jgi:flagellar operon protein
MINSIESFQSKMLKGVDQPSNKKVADKKIKNSEKSEFEQILKKSDKAEKAQDKPLNTKSDEGVKVSNHAIKRIEERSIEMDSNEFINLKNAMEKLRSKGGKDSLVVTDKAAYIVDVDKSTVVTAVDKNKLDENVFTKIDSTIFL